MIVETEIEEDSEAEVISKEDLPEILVTDQKAASTVVKKAISLENAPNVNFI